MVLTQVDNIPDLTIFTPEVYRDNRGYFFESYNQELLNSQGFYYDFIQDNESESNKGVLRGLHFQTGKFAQAKLVRVVQGSVWDVAVDIRKDSISYGKWFGIELSASNRKQLLIPRGFAHGFVALEDNTIFAYKCDNFYNKDFEGGIRFNDAELNIKWPIAQDQLIISQKDTQLPLFSEL